MRAFDRHLCSPLREPLPGTGGRAPGSPGTRRAAWAAARRSRWRPCARPGRGRRTRRTAPSRCRPGTRPPATSPARLDAIVTQGRCLPRTATSGAALATKPTRQGPACAARLVVLVKAAGLHARLRAHCVADPQAAAALRRVRRAPSARAARPAVAAEPASQAPRGGALACQPAGAPAAGPAGLREAAASHLAIKHHRALLRQVGQCAKGACGGTRLSPAAAPGRRQMACGALGPGGTHAP